MSAATRLEEPGPRAISAEQFRAAFSGVPMPVAVVTAALDERPFGTTVSSFCSLSASPPSVLAALDLGSNTLPVLEQTGRFGLNVLAAHQVEAARRCATKDPEKFAGLAWRLDQGLPRLDGTASWFVCEVAEILSGGDHAIVVGRLVGCEEAGGTPLVYHRRGFCAPAELPPS